MHTTNSAGWEMVASAGPGSGIAFYALYTTEYLRPWEALISQIGKISLSLLVCTVGAVLLETLGPVDERGEFAPRRRLRCAMYVYTKNWREKPRRIRQRGVHVHYLRKVGVGPAGSRVRAATSLSISHLNLSWSSSSTSLRPSALLTLPCTSHALQVEMDWSRCPSESGVKYGGSRKLAGKLLAPARRTWLVDRNETHLVGPVLKLPRNNGHRLWRWRPLLV